MHQRCRAWYPVELEGLAGGQADAAVHAVFFGELVDHLPLGRGDDAAGQAGAQHDVVQGLQLLGGALRADVAVILLIHAVKRISWKLSPLKPPVSGSCRSSAMVPRRKLLSRLRRSLSASGPSTGPGISCLLINRHPFDNVWHDAIAQILFCFLTALVAVFRNHFQQGFLHILRHVVGVATHIEVSACFQPLVELKPCLAQAVLHINLVGLIPAEGQGRSWTAGPISHNAATPPDRGSPG